MTTPKKHGKWEATLAMIRVLKRRLDRIEKLLAIKPERKTK